MVLTVWNWKKFCSCSMVVASAYADFVVNIPEKSVSKLVFQ